MRSADEQKLKTDTETDPGILFNLERELSELHTELVYLERLRAQDLPGLVAYVAALRQRIEEYLA